MLWDYRGKRALSLGAGSAPRTTSRRGSSWTRPPTAADGAGFMAGKSLSPIAAAGADRLIDRRALRRWPGVPPADPGDVRYPTNFPLAAAGIEHLSGRRLEPLKQVVGDPAIEGHLAAGLAVEAQGLARPAVVCMRTRWLGRDRRNGPSRMLVTRCSPARHRNLCASHG